MKKLLTVLCGIIIALSLFVTTGNTAKAAGPDEDCTCHNLLPLQGAQRNKIVANLISSDVFKEAKKDLREDGYKWNGANSIEVYQFEGVTAVGVLFTNKEGIIERRAFVNGYYVGPAPDME
ncbi:hypothetical protein J7E79_03240 [Bacillus sp. ISL-40]|uniref:hypothetical protein n=1 Tax=unclassified Bacillus (in: firmicutes) TaxID=185979 RepID=UPI001BE6E287|nr:MULTISPECIES: hypothetical protein [unclassified Bacillus (in: firmicutes)]MBT2696450.1 hypothetical protein [Bacillus sp. ISL-40]MBT2741534.1 hypothetical protein [Bacillus sp. ISL-77]